MEKRFPVVEVGYVFNSFSQEELENINLKYNSLEIEYPCRLDAMAINPAAVTYNDDMIFTPGEVVVSVEKYIKVNVNVIDDKGGNLIISDSTRRKVLVKHSYLLMCKALKVCPSLEISVKDDEIPKHSGFGSSSSTIAAVAVAINELYGNPIKQKDLIKYLASNHGEEINDNNTEELKVVQCIGGGATNGQTDEGIIIISGRACTIAKISFDGDILIGVPNDFIEQDADILMKLEEENLWRFKQTGEKYKDEIAYTFLHKVLPEMTEGKIKSLADIVFDYRFNMGSIKNCSFVFNRMNEIADAIRELYEKEKCDFLALSSVGPAFFAITNNEENKNYCIKKFEELNLKVIESKICNHKYLVNNTVIRDDFWKDNDVNLNFYNKEPSKYITDVIDKITEQYNIKNAIDIGCGGGRYSKYLANKNIDVVAIDKNKEMFQYCEKEKIKNIHFKTENMDNLEEEDNSAELILSIGVIHNSININEYKKSFEEIYRILKNRGYAIISIFTNDLITEDLSKGDYENLYFIKNRPPMILLSKKEIEKIVEKIGFNIIKIVDEHITEVGDNGKRNVWTILLQK